MSRDDYKRQFNRKSDWMILCSLKVCLLIFLFPGILSARFNNQFDIEKHELADENFFDWKAYQSPTSSRYQWYFTPSGFNASVGSISQERFYFEQELRFITTLSPDIFFTYFQYREELFREDALTQEVGFRYGDNYGFAITGFPTHEKRNNAIGAHIAHGHYYSDHYLKIGRLRQNLMYNEKNVSDDKHSVDEEYTDTPTMDEMEIQYRWTNGLFLKADLEKEYETVLQATDHSYQKTYSGSDIKVVLDWFFTSNQMVGLSYRDDREQRSRIDTTGMIENTTARQNLQLRWSDLYYFHRMDNADEITVGFLASRFKNKIEADLPAEQYDFNLGSQQGYIFWQHRHTTYSRMNYGLQAGRYQLYKENEGTTEEDEADIQIKFTLGIELFDGGRYRLLGNSTWDLDMFLYRQWDGGNVQLQTYF
jgi:hypothetical protein